MARKGILTPTTEDGDSAARDQNRDKTRDQSRESAREPIPRPAPRGAVGALQSSLTRLQENAVQEIDPHLIHDAGVADRLGSDQVSDDNLLESIRNYGQQVPVLVRPHDERPGRYQIVYGRRRVLAMRDLGLPVKAMVRHLDDRALVLAQGQENTARQDLSFIEKASFAAQLDASGYDRQTIAAALSIDLPMVSRMLKVGTAFDIDFLRQIGSAPGIGRERWMALAEAVKGEGTRAYLDEMLTVLPFVDGGSDARFEQVLAWATGKRREVKPPSRPDVPAKRRLTTPGGDRLADIRRGKSGLTVTIPAGGADGFDAWLDRHAESLLTDLHARWQAEQGRTDKTNEQQ